jgi:hypothetical protein
VTSDFFGIREFDKFISMTGLEAFHKEAKKASAIAKKLPIINPDALKHIMLMDAPPVKQQQKKTRPTHNL